MTAGDWAIASVIAAALLFVLFGAARGAFLAWQNRKKPDDADEYGADGL